MDNVPIATKHAMIDPNNIVDHLPCTLWIILETFEDIHLFRILAGLFSEGPASNPG
jgi:hypothetical protein